MATSTPREAASLNTSCLPIPACEPPPTFPPLSVNAAPSQVGHNLGLSHDGNSSVGYYEGHANWAPIMGVGYYRPVSQWSKGEYNNANNLEDDLAIMTDSTRWMTNVQQYLAYRGDDHGNTAANATALVGVALDSTRSAASAEGNIAAAGVVHRAAPR